MAKVLPPLPGPGWGNVYQPFGDESTSRPSNEDSVEFAAFDRPTRRIADDVRGEYTDSVSVGNVVFGAIWIGFWSWLLAGLWAGAPWGARIFMSLFPLLGFGAMYLAFTIRTLAFDGSGWRYRRAIFGRTLETEEGRWADATGTRFWQRFVPPARGGGSGVLEGDFAVAGPNGQEALRVTAQLWPADDGVPSSILHNTLGKRAIGLAANDFDRFIRLVNEETPQLNYEWKNAFPDGDAPTPGGFLGLSSGADRYVTVSRQAG